MRLKKIIFISRSNSALFTLYCYLTIYIIHNFKSDNIYFYKYFNKFG